MNRRHLIKYRLRKLSDAYKGRTLKVYRGRRNPSAAVFSREDTNGEESITGQESTETTDRDIHDA